MHKHIAGRNSASNLWLGGDFEPLEPDAVFDKEAHQKYSCLKYTAPYKEAVYALVDFDTDKQIVHVYPKMSEYIGKNPAERGYRGYLCGATVSPSTQERFFRF